MLQGPEPTIRHARALRKAMSPPERLLWRALKTRPAGLKFRRQHPAGGYIADFFCHEARLVVEVDGEAHDRKQRIERDEQRDAWFAEHGFPVLRIPAAEVFKDVEAVMNSIVARVSEISTARTRPPLQGEGDQPKAGGGVSAQTKKAVATAPLTPLRQASPATSPHGGGRYAGAQTANAKRPPPRERGGSRDGPRPTGA